MKNFKLKRLLGLMLVGCLSTLGASTVFAAAGDDITNTATLTYTGGTVDSNTTTFKEDRLLNFTVTTVDVASVPVIASAIGQITTFRVANTGNGPQDFSLLSFNEATAVDDPFVAGGDLDSFDVAEDAIFVNSVIDVAGAYLAGTDTATFIDELPAGSFVDVFVLSTIPTPPPILADGALSVVSLQAQIAIGGAAGQGADIVTDDVLNADTAAEETVFLDAVGTSAVAADVLNDGLDSDNSAYIISAPILTVTKSSIALWDPVNLDVNPKMIPGGYVQFTLVVANDVLATASGDLTTMVDTLIANLNLDFNFIDGAAAPAPTSGIDAAFEIDTTGTTRVTQGVTYCTAVAAGADGCIGLAGSATIDFSILAATGVDLAAPTHTAGELKPGDSITVKFNAIVQ